MAITADTIRTAVSDYVADHPLEKARLGPAFELLDSGADLLSRREMRGHVTVAAIVVNDDNRVLLVQHLASGGLWLFPGGHLETDDIDLAGAVRRELAEETGLGPGLTLVGAGPVWIDIHTVRANPAKNEGTHPHIDFRFLYRVSNGDAAIVLQPEEVGGAEWRDLDHIPNEATRERVRTLLRP